MGANPILAWHFVGNTLRNGSIIPENGKWLKVKPPLKMCERGLHASLEPFDALTYSPGETLCLVEVAGKIIKDTDKLVASHRRIIERMDATEMLRYFARTQALSVVHLWDAPDVVLDYLMTGDEDLRASARDAARDAASGCGAGCGVGCGAGCGVGCGAGCGVGARRGCGAGCGVGCGAGCGAGCGVGCGAQ